MDALIAVLPGDGIGPEVVRQGCRVLTAVAERYGHRFELQEALVGGCAIDATQEALPAATVALCQRADAVLLGAVGGPKWDDPRAKVRPEQGLLGLRKQLDLFANLRPVQLHPKLLDASPLKPEVLRGLDLMVVRELVGGIYFGEKKRDAHHAVDTCVYAVREIERVVRAACQIAMQRRRKLTSVDKANVLETSRLWRETATRVVTEEFPQIHLEHMLVDAAAMHLIKRPTDFDVICTENMFGDILTDEASVLAGSMGMLPSASLGEGRRGLFEPIHGSAPDIAGRGVANPFATILSVALLLRYSLQLEREARAVEQAVSRAIDDGKVTGDIAGAAGAAGRVQAVSTAAAGDAVLERLAG